MNHEILKAAIKEDTSYSGITTCDVWLEDTSDEKFSRYATGTEESVWVCNHCEAVGVDADDHECEE